MLESILNVPCLVLPFFNVLRVYNSLLIFPTPQDVTGVALQPVLVNALGYVENKLTQNFAVTSKDENYFHFFSKHTQKEQLTPRTFMQMCVKKNPIITFHDKSATYMDNIFYNCCPGGLRFQIQRFVVLDN